MAVAVEVLPGLLADGFFKLDTHGAAGRFQQGPVASEPTLSYSLETNTCREEKGTSVRHVLCQLCDSGCCSFLPVLLRRNKKMKIGTTYSVTQLRT